MKLTVKYISIRECCTGRLGGKKIKRFKYYIFTVLGASCWGLIGLFVAPLYERGFTVWDVVAIRGIFTFAFLILFMILFQREQLRTRLKDHLFFAGTGILSMALFNYFYFETFSRSNLSIAVTLLYTGPLFVTILARIFFKEPLTMRKGTALFFCHYRLCFCCWFTAFQSNEYIHNCRFNWDIIGILLCTLQHS